MGGFTLPVWALLCGLLGVDVVRSVGLLGQSFFAVQPQSQVVRAGQTVELECITRKPVERCGWALQVPGLGITEFWSHDIPTNLNITARDKDSKTDCSITIHNVNSQYDGNYTCAPITDSGYPVRSAPASVITAVPPARIEFVGDGD